MWVLPLAHLEMLLDPALIDRIAMHLESHQSKKWDSSVSLECYQCSYLGFWSWSLKTYYSWCLLAPRQPSEGLGDLLQNYCVEAQSTCTWYWDPPCQSGEQVFTSGAKFNKSLRLRCCNMGLWQQPETVGKKFSCLIVSLSYLVYSHCLQFLLSDNYDSC